MQKVASTGYGRGWVLTGQGDHPQLYAYESPYLFKTGPSYILNGSGVLAAGAGAVYLSTVTDAGQATETGHLMALDALTGQERWRRDVPGTTFTLPVYDPALQMVYIAGTDGHVSALDVHTGATTWNYQVGTAADPVVVDAPPALDGGRLILRGPRRPGALPGRGQGADGLEGQQGPAHPRVGHLHAGLGGPGADDRAAGRRG